MSGHPLPGKRSPTSGKADEVAEEAPVTPRARRGEVPGRLSTFPRGTYLQLDTWMRADDQTTHVLRYLRYWSYRSCETRGRITFRAVALRPNRSATEPLPLR